MKPNTLKIEFICGTSFTADGTEISDEQIAHMSQAAEDVLLTEFGGWSRAVVLDVWVSPTTQEVVRDQSLVYTVLDCAENDPIRLQDRLKQIFMQESVPFIVSKVFCKF